MEKIEVYVEDSFIKTLPDGYKLLRFGKPRIGEYFLSLGGATLMDSSKVLGSNHFVVLEKIQPKRRVFELVRENSKAEYGEFYCEINSLAYAKETTTHPYASIYKEIIEDGS